MCIIQSGIAEGLDKFFRCRQRSVWGVGAEVAKERIIPGLPR